MGAVTSAVGPPEVEDAQTLIGATFREQLGRNMLSWGVDEHDPPLPETLKPLYAYLTWEMVAREDRKNRAMLRAYVAQTGWPTIPAAGNAASNAAWLVVKHAAQEPALPLSAPRRNIGPPACAETECKIV